MPFVDGSVLIQKNTKRDALTPVSIAAYAVGHLCNDLTVGLCYLYSLYYYQKVLGLDPIVGGLSVISAQVTDGLTTPIVGIFSDSINTRIGSRMPWYIFGTFFTIPSIVGMFIGPNIQGSTAQLAYFLILPATYNIGYACVQISNMSIVNSLTYSTQRRDRLISLRNGFSFIANVFVLTISLICFAVVPDPIMQFRIIVMIVSTLGLMTSLFYIFTIREPYLSSEAKKLEREHIYSSQTDLLYQRSGVEKTTLSMYIKHWTQWFKQG